jgi:DNA-binding transcriptional regulator YdaS (Cro superfamily)
MNTTEIIKCFGGTFAIARRCGVTPSAVSQWRNNGMPGDKLVLLASDLEKRSDGKWTRKEIPNWSQIWPDLR